MKSGSPTPRRARDAWAVFRGRRATVPLATFASSPDPLQVHIDLWVRAGVTAQDILDTLEQQGILSEATHDTEPRYRVVYPRRVRVGADALGMPKPMSFVDRYADPNLIERGSTPFERRSISLNSAIPYVAGEADADNYDG